MTELQLQYWQDWTLDGNVRLLWQWEQKKLVREHALHALWELDNFGSCLLTALSECSAEAKSIIRPALCHPEGKVVVAAALKASQRGGLTFSERIVEPGAPVKRFLDLLAAQQRQQSATGQQETQPLCKNEAMTNLSTNELTACNFTGVDVESVLKLKTVAVCEISSDKLMKIRRPSVSDLPKEEVTRRLGKGEILNNTTFNRHQWIPGLSTGKKHLSPVEFTEHLRFGEQINFTARAAFQNSNYEDALTKYSQGVRLYEWVTGYDEASSREVQDKLLKFLKNVSLAALNNNRWNEAKEAANRALEIAQADEKSLYRRGKANYMIGNLKEAQQDFLTIIKSDGCDAASRRAAYEGLAEVKRLKTDATKKMNKIFNSLSTEISPTSIGAAPDSPGTRAESNCRDLLAPPAMSSNDPSQFGTRHVIHKDPPSLSKESTYQLLEELLKTFTTEPVMSQLRDIRRSADFDERRILLRVRKNLPLWTQPLLEKFQIWDGNFDSSKKAMDMAVAYWSTEDPALRAMSKDVFNWVLNDAD